MKTPRLHPAGLALGLGLALALASCGSDKSTTPPPPPDPHLHDTPEHAIVYLQESYTAQDAWYFMKIFTSDFRFTFSLETDPDLVAQYGQTWNKDDEEQSAKHLFDGFVSTSTGQFIPGATNITMALNSIQVFDDPAHPDSSAYYKYVVVTRVIMAIEVATTPDPQIYNIDARQEFHLVRGDAALLDPDQTANGDQWYIRGWDDLAASLAAGGSPSSDSGGSPTPANVATWGKVKAQYR